MSTPTMRRPRIRPLAVSAAHALASSPTPSRPLWRWVSTVEVALAVVAVAYDLLLPSLMILALAALSIAARGRPRESLGFGPGRATARLALEVLGLVAAWTMLQIGLVMPLLTHLTGERQDLEGFAELQGDVGLLAVLLALTWTLAAFGEELAFRGYVLSRAREAFGGGAGAAIAAVLVAAVLFGLIHTEQGLIGVAVTTLDGVFLGWLRLHYGTVWAAVLAHGFSNTIGLVTFFLIGPVYGLW